MTTSTYVIALGSNKRHRRHGAPRRVIAAAIAALEASGITVLALSPVIETAPVGPSSRRYANAAAVIATSDPPPALLARLKRMERAFGRGRPARRWAARVLDLDIILWSGGIWASPGLGIPHRHFRARAFVLKPLKAIAPGWRDPLTGLTPPQLLHRLERKTPVDRRPQPS